MAQAWEAQLLTLLFLSGWPGGSGVCPPWFQELCGSSSWAWIFLLDWECSVPPCNSPQPTLPSVFFIHIERVRAPIAGFPQISPKSGRPGFPLSSSHTSLASPKTVTWLEEAHKPTAHGTAAAQVQRVGGVIGADHSAHNTALPHVWRSARDGMCMYDLIHVGIQRPVCSLTCKPTSASTWFITEVWIVLSGYVRHWLVQGLQDCRMASQPLLVKVRLPLGLLCFSHYWIIQIVQRGRLTIHSYPCSIWVPWSPCLCSTQPDSTRFCLSPPGLKHSGYFFHTFPPNTRRAHHLFIYLVRSAQAFSSYQWSREHFANK